MPDHNRITSTGTLALELDAEAEEIIQLLREHDQILTTVESCTGGALAHILTNVPGSGAVLRDSFITYSNESKIALGVPEETIDTHTVYSAAVAIAMAQAGLKKSINATIGIGITGTLAEVDEHNYGSNSGEVYIGFASKTTTKHFKLQLEQLPRHEAKLTIIKEVFAELKRTCDAHYEL